MIVVPLIILLVTPAIRPLRLSRLIFTYLLPAIPIIGLFDGIVSCLRTYSPEEMRQLIKPFNYRSLDHAVTSVKAILEPAEEMAEKIRRKRKEIEDDPW